MQKLFENQKSDKKEYFRTEKEEVESALQVQLSMSISCAIPLALPRHAIFSVLLKMWFPWLLKSPVDFWLRERDF